jgi:hypothetical protein
MQIYYRDPARAERSRLATATKASDYEMAAEELERLIDSSAADEERQRRKRRLLKGARQRTVVEQAKQRGRRRRSSREKRIGDR